MKVETWNFTTQEEFEGDLLVDDEWGIVVCP
jgi:hypothetical protein